MEKFLLILIFGLFSSKINPSIIFGKNTTFDVENNYIFNLKYNGPGNDTLLVYLKSDIVTMCQLSCHGSMSGSTVYGAELFPLKESNVNCEFQIFKLFVDEKEEGKGTFMMLSLKNEIKIKLRNKYGNLDSPLVQKNDNSLKDLTLPDIIYITYSVPNLERNVIAKFEYNSDCDPFTINENPFKVCHDDDCEENIETYSFQKGESYKIMVKLQKMKKNEDDSDFYYVLPGYTFYDKDYNGEDSDDDIIYDGDEDENEKKDSDNNNNNNKALVANLKLFFTCLILLFL